MVIRNTGNGKEEELSFVLIPRSVHKGVFGGVKDFLDGEMKHCKLVNEMYLKQVEKKTKANSITLSEVIGDVQ